MLIYPPEDGAGANRKTSYDLQLNIGSKVVEDVLTRAGILVKHCSAVTAARFDVVLVPLRAYSDALSFRRAVARVPAWNPPRKFVTLAGGPGMVNAWSLAPYADLCLFGRAENTIVPIVSALLDGRQRDSPYLWRLDAPGSVSVAQADSPYPQPIIHRGKEVREGPIGCPGACLFCHYRWTHTLSTHKNGYDVSIAGAGAGVSRETTMRDLLRLETIPGDALVAVDAVSGRIRRAVGKPLRDDEIREAIAHYLDTRGDRGGKLKIYQIVGYPTETERERNGYKKMLCDSLRETASKFMFEHRVFAFRPMPCTPMQWEPFTSNVDPLGVFRGLWAERGRSMVGGGAWMESALHAVRDVILCRAMPASGAILDALALSPKLRSLKSGRGLLALRRSFDLRPYLRGYDIGEPLPTDYIDPGTASRDRMMKMARLMRQRLEEAS